MNRSWLIIVASDPRVSGRAAEAVRIAAGVAAWQKVDVTVYLRGAAVLALGEFPEELVNGENFRLHLPLLAEQGRTIFVAQGEPLLAGLKVDAPLHRPLDEAGLAGLCRDADFVARF